MPQNGSTPTRQDRNKTNSQHRRLTNTVKPHKVSGVMSALRRQQPTCYSLSTTTTNETLHLFSTGKYTMKCAAAVQPKAAQQTKQI